MLRVLGIIGIVIGIAILIATVAGVAFHGESARGYIIGGVIAVAGVARFIRGMNQ
jgi:hypothetical protein